MLQHILKVAFRNHTRYKAQSFITLLSLAISFAFISLAAYWNRYEHTFDSFLADYDRIYQIGSKTTGRKQISNVSYFGLHSHLMDYYHEVDKACGVIGEWDNDRLVEVNDRVVQAGCEKITPEAIDVFGIQWVEGNRNVESWNENEVAVSEEIVRKVCGKVSPVGQKLILREEDGETIKDEYRIAAVFKTWPKHSNFDFHILKKLVRRAHKPTPYYTYVRLHPNADYNRFLNRLKTDTIINIAGVGVSYNTLTPMSEVHIKFPKEKRNLRLNDVKLFTGAAILLAVCALLNYLTLFVSRLRNRGRDMALRAICGSSSWQLGALLMAEYLILLLGSLFFSMMFIELFYNGFMDLSRLKIDRLTVYAGCGYLLLFVFGLAAVLSLIPILYFKNKTLRVQIDSTPIRLGKNRFRIAGVCTQLFISLLFIFCSTVMIKQLHYLIHADIQIERKHIASISCGIGDDRIKDILRQIPSVTEMVTVDFPLYPSFNATVHTFKGITGGQYVEVPAWNFYIDQDIARFYGLRMKEGQESFDLKPGEYLINETFANQLGGIDPIGKVLRVNKYIKGVVKGIVYDYQYQPPTEAVRALYFQQQKQSVEGEGYYVRNVVVAFKYTGEFSECQSAIEKAFKNAGVKKDEYTLYDGETVYNNYLSKELNLLKLLNILTVISVLIALFGVYAQISQECERQRKNIAIRKVFGAQIKDILLMFFKEYMMQVVTAAALAFPIGYVLMKRWLLGYSRQTGVGIEVFLGILLGMAILVSLCIGWHVWRAANENPATAVKKE